MPMDPRVIIVGAGIVGSACADALAEAGASVTVIDSRRPGLGSTGAAMGHIVIMDDSEPQFALLRYSRDLWEALAPELPADCEWERSGTLWIAENEEEMTAVHRKHSFFAERGVETEVIDPKRLAELEPHLRPGLTGALRVPGDRVLYPPCAARFLINRARRHGARILECRVESIIGRLVTLEDGSGLEGDAIVNAAGCDAPRLTPDLPIRPRKGHLVITDRYPGYVRHELVELGYLKSAHAVTSDSVAFNVQPRPTGQLLIGSSRQFDNASTAIDADLLARMLRRAAEFLPGIGNLSATRAWAGFRPATPDKLPLIGPMPGQPGLFIAAGHEGLGIAMALGTARLLADQIVGRSVAIPAEPYWPGRL
jgi:glycine/D-amino acid oxidase-like deaminating enzyme